MEKEYRYLNKKRIISASIVLGAFLLLTACGKDTGNLQANQGKTQSTEELVWQQFADEQITFDWYINYSWFNQAWGENVVSQKITEETGISINFITPSGNESEKMNALIASDSLPDFITLGWWEAQVSEMIEGDMVYALNELADTYDTYFWDVSNPDVIKWYTKQDGNIYCYPNSSCTPEDVKAQKIGSNQTFLVRKDIYEAIGSPDMSTPEGFKGAVRKAAQMFPDVDGEPLIPIGAHVFNEQGNVSFDDYLMNFLAVPFEEDGQLYDRYTNADYIEWLKMFRELGEEGLLMDDIFVDQRTQMEEKMANGRYFCMIYQYTDMIAQQKELYANHPERIYMAVEGPKNSAGDDHTLPSTGINGWTVTLISKNCEYPDRAIAFMNYMLSEYGQMRIYLGVEDVTFDYVDGHPVVKKDIKNLLNTDRIEYDRLYGADSAYWMLQDMVMQQQWRQEEPEPLAQLREWSFPYTVYNSQYDSFLPLDSEEAYIDTKISLLWSETLPQLLLADSEIEFEQIFEEFLKKRDSYGFDELRAAENKLMKQAKEKLGID